MRQFSVPKEDDYADDEAASAIESVKCTAITKKGNQCKGTAQAGFDYCYDHSPPALSSKAKAKAVVSSAAKKEPEPVQTVEGTSSEMNKDTASEEGTTAEVESIDDEMLSVSSLA